MASGTDPRCSGIVSPCAINRPSGSHSAVERSIEFLRFVERAVRTSATAISSTKAALACPNSSRATGSTAFGRALIANAPSAGDRPNRYVPASRSAPGWSRRSLRSPTARRSSAVRRRGPARASAPFASRSIPAARRQPAHLPCRAGRGCAPRGRRRPAASPLARERLALGARTRRGARPRRPRVPPPPIYAPFGRPPPRPAAQTTARDTGRRRCVRSGAPSPGIRPRPPCPAPGAPALQTRRAAEPPRRHPARSSATSRRSSADPRAPAR